MRQGQRCLRRPCAPPVPAQASGAAAAAAAALLRCCLCLRRRQALPPPPLQLQHGCPALAGEGALAMGQRLQARQLHRAGGGWWQRM